MKYDELEGSTAVEAIAELAQDALVAGTRVVEIEGQQYSTTKLEPVIPPRHAPAPLKLHTLKAFATYYRSGDWRPDEFGYHAVHVVSPTEVGLISPLDGEPHYQRFTYAEAICLPRMDGFKFGVFHDVEYMVIALQALFQDTLDRAKVLKLIGTVKNEEVHTQLDDGVTQRATAAAGVALVGEVPVPNPVSLAPYRTFEEVVQPISPFVLRLRRGNGGVTAALFEADGGAWRNDAVRKIADKLAELLPESTTILA